MCIWDRARASDQTDMDQPTDNNTNNLPVIACCIPPLVDSTVVDGIDYAELTLAGAMPGSLIPATEQTLETHLKNGIRLTSFDIDLLNFNGHGLRFPLSNVPLPGAGQADFVKSDGEHIYMSAGYNDFFNPKPRPPSIPFIRILSTDAVDASVRLVSELPIEDNPWHLPSDLLLVTNGNGSTEALATIENSARFRSTPEPQADVFFNDYPTPTPEVRVQSARAFPSLPITRGHLDHHVQISLYDVSEATEPTKTWTAEIDGILYDSYRIGDILYLVAEYTPELPAGHFFHSSVTQVQEVEAGIAQTPLADLLPQLRINGASGQSLLQAEDCLIPEGSDNNSGYPTVVSIVAIDLAKRIITDASCLSDNVQAVYEDGNSLYLVGSGGSQAGSFSVFHKFMLEQGNVRYRSTGSVAGTLGLSAPSLRMDERDGYLRVVSSYQESDNSDFVHQLHVLEDVNDSTKMNSVATLPNSTSLNNADAISHASTDISAVRFLGDRAFIVSAIPTDPLFVIDLSRHNAPMTVGTLQVPGLDDVLYPVSQNVLVGIGRDIEAQGPTGVITRLYTMADLNNLKEVDRIVVGDQQSVTEAITDPRAITFFRSSDDQLRFAFTIERTHTEQSEGISMSRGTTLHQYEINGLSLENASLSAVGEVFIGSANVEPSRSVLAGDAAFIILRDNIWSAFWGEPGVLSGPN